MKPVPSSGAGQTLRKYLSSFMHTQKSIYNCNVFDPKTLEHNVTLQCIIFYASCTIKGLGPNDIKK